MPDTPKPCPSRTQIWSCGGGTQSTAIAVLIIQGVLPKPDLSVIVDTERERRATWDYLERWTLPALREVGVELHRVPKSRYATVDLWGGKGGDALLIPAFTDQSGDTGKLPTYCSNEWKRRVVQRWATDEGAQSGALWIGFSTDERRRFPKTVRTEGKWIERYVLADLGMSRGDCYRVVEKHGWPFPPRSRCWMCPNQNEEEWMETMADPVDAAKVKLFEEHIQDRDPHAWLHHSCKPIEKVEFDTRQNVMFGGCDSGMCFT